MTKQKQVFRNVCKRIKKKNLNIPFTKVFRPFTQYFVETSLAAITASSLLGYDATSLAHIYLGSSSHSSLQILSSSVRMDGEHCCTAIFRSLQRLSIGFKSGLWLGYSRTFRELSRSDSCVALTVCLELLSCWKVNLHPSLRSWVLWSRLSSRIYMYFAPFNFASILSPSPCRWKTTPQHDNAPNMLHHRDVARFLPDVTLVIQAKVFNLGFIRPENLGPPEWRSGLRLCQ